jgi:glycosyltransferase involved in cell wall biosynthesis
VLEAYVGLLKLLPTKTAAPQLVLFGAEWRSRGIEDIVAQFGLTDAVRILGRVSEKELIALYSTALCIVYGSSFEGYGLPILEAMACGCPVITTNASSLPEIADNAAIMVDPFDVDAMTDAMSSFIRDSVLRDEYREKGLTRVSRLSWDRTARATLEVLEG